jgi:hypothetical protein
MCLCGVFKTEFTEFELEKGRRSGSIWHTFKKVRSERIIADALMPHPEKNLSKKKPF